MNVIFKKMQVKAHDPLCVLNAPEEFLPNLQEMEGLARIVSAYEPEQSYPFILIFVKNSEALAQAISELAGKPEGDALVWIAYPKKSSKKYTSDIHRDAPVWGALGELGYEGVRQVAIDSDWSALRFRQTKYIKKMKRDPKRAMSKEGKARTENQS